MTRAQRGQQIWQVLVSAANNRQVLTYGLLATHIGMGSGTLAGPLGTVMYYCKRRDWPPLTVLVVRAKRGKPGTGLTTTEDEDFDREAVFNFKWFTKLPPKVEDLEQAYAWGQTSDY